MDEFGTVEERKGRFVAFEIRRARRARPTVHRNEWFFAPFKDCPVEDASITIGTAESASCQVTLSTDKPAFFVWVNATGVRGEFDDNSFTLLPGEPRTLAFAPKGPVAAETFRRALSVVDLGKSFDSRKAAGSVSKP